MEYSLILFCVFMLMMLYFDSFLMILISFEFMLVLILHLSLKLGNYMYNDWIFLIILVMGVCESVLGLSLMISMIFLYGNQSIKLLNLMW